MAGLEHHIITPGMPSARGEWEAFLRVAAGSTVYHREPWLYALAHELGQSIRIHVVVEAGRVLAGAVVRQGGVWGLRTAGKPWATAYNGLVLAPEATPRHVTALQSALRRAYAHVRLVQAPEAALPMERARGWGRHAWTTLLLDVRDPLQLWETVDRRVRQRIRKARDLGVRVDEAAHGGVFEELYRQTYTRQEINVQLPRGSIARTLDTACASGLIRMHVASTGDGEPAAALVTACDVHRAYFMLAASHPQLRQSDAVSLLWWSAFEQYAGQVGEVDLVGVGTPEIERFKRSFAPRTVDCSELCTQGARAKLVPRLSAAVHALRASLARRGSCG